MARVNVRCWQETYRGLVSDAVLDDAGFLSARARFWSAALTDERYRENRVAVAERDGQLVGIAMSGPPLDAAAAWARQLYVLYVSAAQRSTARGRAQRCSMRSSIRRSRRRCGSPTRTRARRRSTASTASLPTGRLRSRTGCGRCAWSAACTPGSSPAQRRAAVANVARRREHGRRASRSRRQVRGDHHRIRCPSVREVQFSRELRHDVLTGDITLSVRLWKRPQVKEGGRYRVGPGMVEVDAVDLVPFAAITEADIRRAGEPDRETLRNRAAHAGPIDDDTLVYRIEFHALSHPG